MQIHPRLALVLLASACSPEIVSVDEAPMATESESESPDVDQPIDASCDPFAQDCPTGEKCVPYASTGAGNWDDNKCVPILGDGEPGDACTYDGPVAGTDTCGAGSLCWHMEELVGGTCTPFCTGTADEPSCAEGSACFLAIEATINLCFLVCDPLAPNCPDGQSCLWSGTEYLCWIPYDC
jgi:hypothetical protein